MYIFFVDSPFLHRLFDAICWMLIHSLWQGFLLALAAGLVIILTKKTAPSVRYNCLTTVFALFLAAVIATFFIEWQTTIVHSNNSVDVISTPINEPAVYPISAETAPALLPSLKDFMNRNAAIIVCSWFIILVIRSVRLAGGLYKVSQLKRRMVSSPGEGWTNRLEQLSGQMAIREKVKFLQSAVVRIPVVIGHLKPVILFPVGLINHLSPDEVEAILIHELAHIKRSDFLVNLLQSFIERLFFFNPAVLWVSSLISNERENCCDDIVVSQTNDRRNYIQALLSFSEYNGAANQWAIGLAGKKYHLLARVRRIIYNNNKTLNAMEKFVLGSGVIVVALAAIAYHPKPASTGKQGTIESRYLHELGNSVNYPLDTIPTPMKNKDEAPDRKKEKDILPSPSKDRNFDNIQTNMDGKEYKLILKNNKVSELYIDGSKIPNDKIADYDSITSKIILQAKENWDRDQGMYDKAREMDDAARGLSEQSKYQAEKERELVNQLRGIERDARQRDAELGKIKTDEDRMELKAQLDAIEREHEQNDDARGIDRAVRDKIREQMLVEQQKNAQAMQQDLEQRRRNLERDSKRMKEVEVPERRELRERAEIERKESLELREQAELAEEDARRLELLSRTETAVARKAEMDARKMTNGIIDDLAAMKIISNKNDLSFTLSSEELTVNGIRQPDNVFRKFKEKYVKKEGMKFSYNNKNQE